MSATLPAVVLGGTGYVAGELLRLIAAHPHFRLAAVMSAGHPGEPVAGAFPPLVSAYTRPPLRPPSQCAASCGDAIRCALLGRAAWRLGGPRRWAARRRRGLRHAAAGGRSVGRLPLRLGADVHAGLRPRARRAGPARAVQLRAPGAPGAARNPARRPPRLLRHRDAAGERAAARLGTRHTQPLRERGHRARLRAGRKPVPRHAPSAAARRPGHRYSACTATPEVITARPRRALGRVRLRPHSRPLRARHPRDAQGRARAPAIPPSCRRHGGPTTPTRRSCA
jgi:hypothetical protein